MSVVLMYHSLYEGDDTSTIDAEDLPYAVSKENFILQLDQIAKLKSGVFTAGETADVIITFDDGHQSNLDIAVPLLLERGLGAYFFITSGFVDSRPGFLSSDGVAELAKVPGMIVGSHGVTHKFFDDLSSSDAHQELVKSKAFLENIMKHPCESMSFPGGRYNKGTLGLLRSAGYTQWFGSDVGMVNVSKSFDSTFATVAAHASKLLPMTGTQPLKRVAIRRTTQLDEFDRMIAPDRSYYRSHGRRSQAKKILQKTLGNRLYYGLYKSVSAR
jgi:peptidoglycan/xylan/chitin deacetylase (PgdA/CDA1 family)